MRDKTYLLGSSEAMKYEPRLDEEYYSKYPELETVINVIEGKEFDVTYAAMQKAARLSVDLDNTLAKLKVNMQELEDSYLEDSITEQAEDGAFYYNQLVEETRR